MLLDDLITSVDTPYFNNDMKYYDMTDLYIPYYLLHDTKYLKNYSSYFQFNSQHGYYYKNDHLYIFPNFMSSSNKINYGTSTCYYGTGSYVEINMNTYDFVRGSWRTKCYQFNGDTLTGNTLVYNLYPLAKFSSSGDMFKIGTSYIDDLVYSNQTSNILISMCYCFIPLILFIITIKIFRKGLFK